MPYRRLPNSDRARLSALMQAEQKLAHLGSEPNPLSLQTMTQLGELLPTWAQAIAHRDTLRSRRNAVSTRTRDLEDALRLKISHYFQVMNLAIRRGDAPIGMRAICGLDLNQKRLPALSTQQQVNFWAHQITRHLDSDFANAVQSPSAQDIADELTTFEFALIEIKRAKTAYDNAMEAAQALRPAVDELIRDIWDEIDFHYRKQRKSSIRRKASAFGVVYVSVPGESPPEDAQEDTPEDTPEDAPEDAPDSASEDMPENAQENTPQNTLESASLKDQDAPGPSLEDTCTNASSGTNDQVDQLVQADKGQLPTASDIPIKSISPTNWRRATYSSQDLKDRQIIFRKPQIPKAFTKRPLPDMHLIDTLAHTSILKSLLEESPWVKSLKPSMTSSPTGS